MKYYLIKPTNQKTPRPPLPKGKTYSRLWYDIDTLEEGIPVNIMFIATYNKHEEPEEHEARVIITLGIREGAKIHFNVEVPPHPYQITSYSPIPEPIIDESEIQTQH